MPEPMLLLALAVFFVLLATALLLTANGQRRREHIRRPHRDRFRTAAGTKPPRRRAAVVVNPLKVPDVPDVTARLAAVCRELDWDEPTIHETTATDSGERQTRTALAEGVDLVVVLGGDGTVRACAGVLVGTGTPLGLLPAGTGNLLARNLPLPQGNLEEAMRIACTGRNRPIDVGWITLDPIVATPEGDGATDTPEERHAFVVMAGLGFDATIMAGTSEEAKAKIGWTAYVATGLRNLRGPGFTAQVAVDGGDPVAVHARTILVGNCGRLTGGINLMPDAVVDDGLLDAVVLSPKGIAGWLAIGARVLTQDRKGRHERLLRHTGTRFDITTDIAEPVELDGDIIGEATHIVVTVEPRGLLVRIDATVTT